MVLFSNEENGLSGARSYAKEYGSQHFAAIEADIGAGAPELFHFKLPEGHKGLADIREQLESNLAPLKLKALKEGYAGADINPLVAQGVLGFGLRMNTDGYWPIHHTWADTIDKIDPQNLRRNTAAMATMAWSLANLP